MNKKTAEETVKPTKSKETAKAAHRKPATFFIWLVVAVVIIYVVIFGFVSQRFENRLDEAEHRANIIVTQLSTLQFKKALGRISKVQNLHCPIRPYFHKPYSIYKSIFLKDVFCDRVVKELKNIVEDWKNDLQGVDLSKAFLMNADLSKAKLREAFLSNADLSKAFLSKADLSKAKLEGAFLKNADLSEAYLYKAFLMNANLREVDLYKADLERANLFKADLWKANLKNVNLNNANLSKAKLRKANLWEANLFKADLRNADLKWAFLERANFWGANLEEANLEGAKLEGAYLEEVNLKNTRNLTLLQLSKVKTLYGVRNLDPKLEKKLKEKYPHLFEKPKY